jgi:hypothetical protein
MKLRLLKHGQPLPQSGSSSKAAKQAAAAAAGDKPKRRSKQTAATQQEAAAADASAEGDVGSNGSGSGSNGVSAAAEQGDWQVFCYQEGLKEYVQW